MAIKTKEEIFGDDGANGPRVPVSETAPTGTSAPNRGTQFGEAVTSDVANRAPYALAINDEDLNARLVSFETDGLDAAYRLGLTASAGGGRVITKDGGAVETVSALAGMYTDDGANAHFRADMTGDSQANGVGFEARGRGAAGFLYVEQFSAAGASVLTANMSATLNVGGSGGNYIQLNGGNSTQDASGNTDLTVRTDLVRVVVGGVATIYIVYGVFSLTSMSVMDLSGNPPAFAADTAATVTVLRPCLGTFSGGTARDPVLGAPVFVGNGGAASLAVVATRKGSLDTNVGSAKGFVQYRRKYNGFVGESFSLGPYGEATSFRVNPDLADTDQVQADGLAWGPPALTINTMDYSVASPDGLVSGVLGKYAAPDVLHDMGLVAVDAFASGDAAISGGFSASFLVGTSNVQLAVTPVAGLPLLKTLVGCRGVMECTSSSDPSQKGFYLLGDYIADDTYQLLDLRGKAISFAAATGTWKLFFILSRSGISLAGPGVNPSQDPLDQGSPLSPGASLYAFGLDISGGSLRVVNSNATGPKFVEETFTVSSSGAVRARQTIEAAGLVGGSGIEARTGDVTALQGDVVATLGDVVATAGNVVATAGDVVATAGNVVATAADVVAGARIRFSPAKSKSVVISALEGKPTFDSSGIANWSVNNSGPSWISRTNSTVLWIPLRFMQAVYITTIEVLLSPGAAHNTAVAVGRNSTLNWGAAAGGAYAAIDTNSGLAAGVQVSTLDNGAGGDIGTVDPAHPLYVRVVSGTTGSTNTDFVFAVRVNMTITDVVE